MSMNQNYYNPNEKININNYPSIERSKWNKYSTIFSILFIILLVFTIVNKKVLSSDIFEKRDIILVVFAVCGLLSSSLWRGSLIKENGRLNKKRGFALISILILTVIFSSFSLLNVSGNSMSPTLRDRDLLILNTFKVTPKNDDIIVLFLEYKQTWIVKRAVAIGGDEIEFDGSKLKVNGVDIAYPHSFIEDEILMITRGLENQNGKYTLPKDRALVLGDNSENSTDSRDFGLISYKQIAGKVIYH